MSVVVIGANHRTAPLELLEKMALDGERLSKYLDALCARDHISEAVIVSTCNRTEIYVVAEQFHGAYRDVRDLVSDLTYLPPDEFTDHLDVAWDADAVQHLFRVSSGLDSVVVGEHEILGQVRTAWDLARDRGAAGPTLNLLFRHALECGKRARTETSISRSVTSVSQAAVVMAAERLGTLAGRRAVVLGAGDMGRGMVHLLADVDVDSLTVVNRDATRAAEVAALVDGRSAPLSGLAAELAEADVLFTATGASEAILGPDEITAVMAGRADRALLVVDIAVPRDVDPAVAAIDGVELLDMSDLQAFCDVGLAERRREVPAVEEIVDSELTRWSSLVSSREVAPLVGEIHRRSEAVRQAELERYAAKLATLSPAEREAVEALTRGIVAKMLHTPTVRLKDAAGSPRGERLATSVRDLFEIE